MHGMRRRLLLSRLFKRKQPDQWLWPQQLYECPRKRKLHGQFHNKFMRMVMQGGLLRQQRGRQLVMRKLRQW